MAGYSGTPLVNKIGIKPGHRVLFINAPAAFKTTLGELSPDTKVVTKGAFDVAIVFVTSAAELEERLPLSQKNMEQNGMIWIGWPKKSSGVATDLVEDKVRAIALANGLVDVKVCAIDDTWSGLKLVIRLVDRVKAPATTRTAKTQPVTKTPAKRARKATAR
jgi:hypothetical protein